MPLYDYRCKSCEHEFEELQSIHDAVLQDCPECGRPDLKKKVSAPAFTFKGEGWYKDLYGKPAPQKKDDAAKSGSDGSASSSSTSDSGSKSAPAAKASKAPSTS